jgi:hypothetical protein
MSAITTRSVLGSSTILRNLSIKAASIDGREKPGQYTAPRVAAARPARLRPARLRPARLRPEGTRGYPRIRSRIAALDGACM